MISHECFLDSAAVQSTTAATPQSARASAQQPRQLSHVETKPQLQTLEISSTDQEGHTSSFPQYHGSSSCGNLGHQQDSKLMDIVAALRARCCGISAEDMPARAVEQLKLEQANRQAGALRKQSPWLQTEYKAFIDINTGACTRSQSGSASQDRQVTAMDMKYARMNSAEVNKSSASAGTELRRASTKDSFLYNDRFDPTAPALPTGDVSDATAFEPVRHSVCQAEDVGLPVLSKLLYVESCAQEVDHLVHSCQKTIEDMTKYRMSRFLADVDAAVADISSSKPIAHSKVGKNSHQAAPGNMADNAISKREGLQVAADVTAQDLIGDEATTPQKQQPVSQQVVGNTAAACRLEFSQVKVDADGSYVSKSSRNPNSDASYPASFLLGLPAQPSDPGYQVGPQRSMFLLNQAPAAAAAPSLPPTPGLSLELRPGGSEGIMIQSDQNTGDAAAAEAGGALLLLPTYGNAQAQLPGNDNHWRSMDALLQDTAIGNTTLEAVNSISTGTPASGSDLCWEYMHLSLQEATRLLPMMHDIEVMAAVNLVVRSSGTSHFSLRVLGAREDIETAMNMIDHFLPPM